MRIPIYLSLGSNQGDRHENLDRARHEISRLIGPIITASSIYKTAAWGNTDQPDFYNQAIELSSSQKPEELLFHISEIEKSMGRFRKEKWGPRVIDIDILFCGNAIIKNEKLTIPHPEIQNRKFVLVPLAEIAATFQHPANHKTIRGLLAECKDTLAVERV